MKHFNSIPWDFFSIFLQFSILVCPMTHLKHVIIIIKATQFNNFQTYFTFHGPNIHHQSMGVPLCISLYFYLIPHTQSQI